jgi:hypothetical protein
MWLKVLESRMLRRIFGPKRDEVNGSGRNCIIRNLMITTPHTIFLGD